MMKIKLPVTKEAILAFWQFHAHTKKNAKTLLTMSDYWEEDRSDPQSEAISNMIDMFRLDALEILLSTLVRKWRRGQRNKAFLEDFRNALSWKSLILAYRDQDLSDDEQDMLDDVHAYEMSKIWPMIQPDSYYENCAGHPCLCTERNDYTDTVHGIDLTVNGPAECSLMHCVVRPLCPEEALLMSIENALQYAQREKRLMSKTYEYAPGGVFRLPYMDKKWAKPIDAVVLHLVKHPDFGTRYWSIERKDVAKYMEEAPESVVVED